MKKRVACFLLVCAILLFFTACFTACGDTSEGIGETDLPESQAPGESPFSGQTLRISSVLRSDERIAYSIAQFQELHPGVEIIVNFYGPDSGIDLEKYQQQISTALMAGTADDLIAADGLFEMSMQDSGLFADIYPLMQNDPNFHEDDYYMNVFEALSYQDKLYLFPVLFIYDLVGVNTTFAPELAEEFTQYDTIRHRELFALYESLADTGGRCASQNLDAYTTLTCNINAFIDLENKTCHFDTPQFVELITAAKNATDPEKISKGELGYLYSWNLYDPLAIAEQAQKDLFFYAQTFSLDYFLPGMFDAAFTHFIPLTDENHKVVMLPSDMYLINAASENKELAWEFLKFLPTAKAVKNQYAFGFPVNRTAFKQQVAASAEQWNYYLHGQGGHSVDLEEAELIDYVTAMGDKFNALPMTSKATAYSILPDIYIPLLQSFYDGRMTAEQVASELQNKVSLYLME